MITYSRFPTPDSRFPIPYSRFPTPHLSLTFRVRWDYNTIPQ
ncbi:MULTISPECIES: hypothetical protein [Moorena]|nr:MULTISPECIES: hypothetical protein [Moorena]